MADVIWSGLGEVVNYVEPFAGSLAVLLANPNISKIETVNDIDCFITNFWRAVSANPQGVAKYANSPVNELDLHARHRWLLQQATDEFRIKLDTDPDYHDCKIAGWWVWGMGASIGNNWLQPKGLNSAPLLSSAGGGIHGLSHDIFEWLQALQQRTRRVRVCCGDWKKVVTPSVTFNNVGISPKDITGIFLDPPYDYQGRDKVYKEENNVFHEVYEWAIANGDNPKLRIALCGYEDDHTFPTDWKTFAWKSGGGYSGLGDGKGKANAKRERIHFSPHCLEIK